MRASRLRSSVACLLISLATIGSAQTLKIGMPAPPIKVTKWVKGTPVEGFKKGQIYVVEFWATWCVPCRSSIPHLTELAKKFHDKVTFIGVSVSERDQEMVGPFVEAMGDTMDYNVATDYQESSTARRGFMSINWLEASNQPALPDAFVVDEEGQLAWIGHPLRLEPVLNQVVAGSWDAQAYAQAQAADAAERMKAKEAWERHPVKLEMDKIRALLRTRDFQGALKEIDAFVKMDGTGTPANPLQFGTFARMTVYGLMNDMEGYYKAANTAAEVFDKDPRNLNVLAWIIVDPRSTLPKKDFDFGVKIAMRAVALTERKEASLLDTLAWAYFRRGDKAMAISTINEALAVAKPNEKSSLEFTLQEFNSN